MSDVTKVWDAMDGVAQELERARSLHPAMRSAHEGFAVLLEQVDELKAEVWKRGERRDVSAMRKEALQVAAMAVRFVVDVCGEDGAAVPAGFVDVDPDGDHATEEQRGAEADELEAVLGHGRR